MPGKKGKGNGSISSSQGVEFTIQLIQVEELKPHPRNYREHPQDQIDHIIQSINEHGFYKNIVAARDRTVLAGHGVLTAVKQMGWSRIPAKILDLDPDDPRALKILTGDNELGHLGIIDDRQLSELLKEINNFDPAGLMGTGFDQSMLSNLVYVTRPRDEIQDIDEAAEWAGLPGYEPAAPIYKCIVSFKSEEDRAHFMELINVTHIMHTWDDGKTWSIWYPDREREDISSIKWEVSDG